MPAPLLTESERGEVLLGLRELRASTNRSIRNTERKLAGWTDESEAGNPGFRQFLYTALDERMARLERIKVVIAKVNRLEVAP